MSSIKNAIISVYDKDNLDKLIPYLEQNNYQIYSTGGTMTHILKYIKKKSNVFSISEYTGFPEICQGRVKSLHPSIYGGILGIRTNPDHLEDLIRNDIKLFDLIVVNLYPFEKVLEQQLCEAILLENIDIGGPSLLRAGAKNYQYISVLSSPDQYENFINKKINNKKLAKQAFQSVMKYDIAINNWFNEDNEVIGQSYTKVQDLKYGLNPYMKPSYICTKNNQQVPFEILNGNPGYINLLDMHYAIHLVLEAKNSLFNECCASFKHNSPAGVALANGLTKLEHELYNPKDQSLSYGSNTFLRARNIDPKSSFGDIVGYSGTVDKEMANALKRQISDGIIASDYTEEALEILRTKKDGNYLILQQSKLYDQMEFRDINGITLVQPNNNSVLDHNKLKDLPLNIKNDMILGYITLKYTQSNSVCFVSNGRVIGIGAGQQNRVDCIKIAGEKAKEWIERHKLDINTTEITLISDAFFPFADNIEVAAKYDVKYVLQPGGSIRDEEINKACEIHGIKMILSDMRVFTH
jgi:phosphoribosylaminoimidazolecarboxamide formyltransferase/IMP cyclohydrolase